MGWSRRPVRGARRGMAEPEGACRGKGRQQKTGSMAGSSGVPRFAGNLDGAREGLELIAERLVVSSSC